MGGIGVVVDPEGLGQNLGFEQGLECFDVEQLVAQLAVEGLDEGVLPRVSRLDVTGGRGRERHRRRRALAVSSVPLSILRCSGVRPAATMDSRTATVWPALLPAHLGYPVHAHRHRRRGERDRNPHLESHWCHGRIRRGPDRPGAVTDHGHLPDHPDPAAAHRARLVPFPRLDHDDRRPHTHQLGVPGATTAVAAGPVAPRARFPGRCSTRSNDGGNCVLIPSTRGKESGDGEVRTCKVTVLRKPLEGVTHSLLRIRRSSRIVSSAVRIYASRNHKVQFVHRDNPNSNAYSRVTGLKEKRR